MAKVKSVRKHLYIGGYDVHGGGILVVQSKSGRMRLVGGRVAWEYIHRIGSELWKRYFASKKMEEQIGATCLVKKNELVLIHNDVQPLPASYDVVRCHETPKTVTICEYSAIAIGEFDCRTFKNPQAFFISFDFLQEKVRQKKISPIQEILMLRIMASGVNPNQFEARRAGVELRRKHYQ